MTVDRLKKCAAACLVLLLAGCVTAEEAAQYSTHGAGYSTVRERSADAIGKETVWVQSRDEAEALQQRVRSLVRGKTIDADTAVQVALLNNRGLQAAYADIGISAADAWQETLPPNPTISIGLFGIGAPELGAWRAIEGMIANNILALATQRQRVDLADTRFRQTQLKAAQETLRIAADARRAWATAVAAFETVAYLNQAEKAADAASELARKLGETGAMPKAAQAREHAFYAELAGQKAQARLAARLAKEDLTRLMGLWGDDLDYFVPDTLPELPRKLAMKEAVEAEALQRRVDLEIARLELEATARNFGLTDATRYVTDLELLAGLEKEREIEDGDRKHTTTGQVELEFVIPIFDSGQARMRKAELTYMKAANLLAEKAVNVRSQARATYAAYRSTHDIARHYSNAVLPLRALIEEEALLTYNGMITNTFELLADIRAKINTVLLAANARRDFWIADTNLTAAIYGGGSAGAGDETTVAMSAGSGRGH